MNKKGKIIVLEGVDGTGKTTQIEILKEKLKDKNFIFLREPGGLEFGQKLRKLILDFPLDAKTELMLFYSARNELILNQIIPAIEKGQNVFLDRFELSSYTYQIYGRERMDLKDFIDKLSFEVVPNNFIDKYYFLDLDVEISKKRDLERREKSTRFDAEEKHFFNRVRFGYKKEIARFNHKIIDASKNIEDVTKDILSDLDNIL